MTALWLMKLSDDEWAKVGNEVREYGIELARKLGSVPKQRQLNDDEWDTQNAINEQDWCQTMKGTDR